jgi:bacteriochlorophyll 4-vinyl reductase
MTMTDLSPRVTQPAADREPVVGPHAIVHVARVMQEWFGDATAGALLAQSTPFSLRRLPQSWVCEQQAKALSAAVYRAVGPRWAATVLRDAGRRTGLSVAAAIPTSIERAIADQASLFTGPGRIRWSPATAAMPAHLTLRDSGPRCVRDTGSLTTFFSAALEHLLRVQLPAPWLRVTALADTVCARGDYRFEVTGLPPQAL